MLQPMSPSASVEEFDEIKATLSPTVSPSMSSYLAPARRLSSGNPTCSVDGAPQNLSSSSCSTPRLLRTLSPSSSPQDRSVSAPPPGMAIKSAGFANVSDDIAVHHAKLLALRDDLASIAQTPDSFLAPTVQEDEKETQQAPDLNELARLLRLEKYQRRKRLQTETAFRRSHIEVSKARRLNVSVRHVRRTLTDCLRSEDKHSFANLLNAYHGVCQSQDPSATATANLPEQTQGVSYSTGSFWSTISSGARQAILNFLSSIRFDPQYVADRLDALNHRELLAILPDGGHARSGESVLATYPRSSSRSTKPMGYVVDRLIDDMSASAFKSPLELMVHLHNPSGPADAPDAESTTFWAGVCARLISGQKHGSHRLVPALLDFWSDQHAWPGRQRVRLWILRMLKDGQFILEQPNRQTFRMRATGLPDLPYEEHRRTEDFYQRSVDSLLDLLGDETGASVIPDGARDFAQAMSEQMEGYPDHQKALPKYLTRWWLFASFIPDLLTLPESYGLLYDYYVSENACHKLLRQIAARSQKAVLDVIYPWKCGNVTPADTKARVDRVLGRFECISTMPASPHEPLPSASGPRANATFHAISASDIATLINALHPCRRPLSISSDRDTLRSGMHSSSSSVSGLSLFPSVNTSSQELMPSLTNANSVSLQATLVATGSMPAPVSGDVVSDSALFDARIELEDLLAANQRESDWHWIIVRPIVRDLGISTHDALLRSAPDEKPLYPKTADSEETSEMAACRRALVTLLESHACTEDSSTRTAMPLLDAYHPDITIGLILNLLEHNVASSEARLDFVGAHAWLSSMQDIEDYVDAKGCEAVKQLLWDIRASAVRNGQTCELVTDRCIEWYAEVETSLMSAAAASSDTYSSLFRLRAKMWYVSDVRTSSAYDQLLSVSSALQMMGKARNQMSSKQMPPLRHSNGSRSTNQHGPLRSDAQILELLGASSELGGPNKLTGEQAKLTSSWLDRSSIQNICHGEERLHKICMDFRNCVDQLLLPSPGDASLLWSNVLFSQDAIARTQTTPRATGWADMDSSSRRFDALRLQTNVPPSIDSISSASHTLSSVSSREYFETRSPTLTTTSSGTFWSPAMTEVQSPSSVTSASSIATRGPLSPRRPTTGSRLDGSTLSGELREALAGFLLSDIGTGLFGDGSETDKSFLDGLGGELIEQHLHSQGDIVERLATEEHVQNPRARQRKREVQFDFVNAFRNIFALFSSECDPFRKLQRLNDIQALLPPYMSQRHRVALAFANDAAQDFHCNTAKAVASSGDENVEGFYAILCHSSIRPAALFRDLQYIASLVPNTILDSSRGKAFWCAATAASRIKLEARKIFVETADSIIAHHTSSRGHGHLASIAQQQRDSATFTAPTRTPSAEAIARYSMADAATLLQIAAKEGDATAQRELATLYLTHPELMNHVIAPFARPRDVFRDNLESKWKKDKDSQKCDPRTMCVAHHWMELAAKSGDNLAREFLRQQDEMERLPTGSLR